MITTLDTRVRAMLNPLGTDRDYESERVDDVQDIDAVTSRIRKISLEYRCNRYGFSLTEDTSNYDIFMDILSYNYATLNPTEIMYLVDDIIKTDNRLDKYFGSFISIMIEKSYRVGYNDFQLRLKNNRIPNILYHIRGENECKINVSIFGSVSDAFASQSTNLNVSIKGDVFGDSMNFMGGNEINVYGTVSNKSSLDYSTYSIIRTTDKKAYHYLEKILWGYRWNKIALIDHDGKEIEHKSEYENNRNVTE
jgi:hypothetical protein